MHDNQAPLATRDLFAAALFLGLAAAAGELCVLAYRHFVSHRVLRLTSNVAWMAPVNDAIAFCLIAVALFVVFRSMRHTVAHRVVLVAPASLVGLAVIFFVPALSLRVREAMALVVVAATVPLLERGLRAAGARRVAVFVLVFAAAYAVALAWRGLLWWAPLILAAGVARTIAVDPGRSARLFRVARTGAATLGVLFTVIGAGLGVWHVVGERSRIAALPDPAPGARNVLLIIWDTVRSESLGLYGNPRNTTPALERFASRGITFDWAFATAPWTLPSHASFFTGRFPRDLSAEDIIPLDDEYPTLAERLSGRGFVTAGIVANGYYCNVENGLARGFVQYQDFVVSPTEVLLATSFGRALSPQIIPL